MANKKKPCGTRRLKKIVMGLQADLRTTTLLVEAERAERARERDSMQARIRELDQQVQRERSEHLRDLDRVRTEAKLTLARVQHTIKDAVIAALQSTRYTSHETLDYTNMAAEQPKQARSPWREGEILGRPR